jgi:CRISPR-associated protein Csm1
VPPARIDERAHLLAVAGLLHDVGKVLEPARVPLTSQEFGLEAVLCPTMDWGQATHRHVLWTAYALNRVQGNYGGLDPAEVFRVACYHHRPSPGSADEEILTRADRLASGHDRRPADEGSQDRVTGLWSIFAALRTTPEGDAGQAVQGQPRQLRTAPLTFDAASFLPLEGPPQFMETYREQCTSISEGLLRALHGRSPNPRAAVERLLGVSERFLHAVPGSRRAGERPDVSLHDHSRATAAFAACLAAQSSQHGQPAAFRLAAFAVGGIQDFIFRSLPPVDSVGSVGKGAARLLRARSFYVTLLTWLAGRRLIETMGLPATNLVLDAGGEATLLLPGDVAAATAIEQALQYIRAWVVRHLAGTIRLRVAVTDPVDQTAFLRGRFGDTFRQLHASMERARLGPPSSGFMDADRRWASDGWIGDGPGLPVDTRNFAEALTAVGQALPKAGWLALDAPHVDSELAAIDVLGYRVSLHDADPGAGVPHVWTLGASTDDSAGRPAFITANYVPTATQDDVNALLRQHGARDNDDESIPRVGTILTFEHLAQLSAGPARELSGHAMLGALKADVDRLGLLLAYGVREPDSSFGRLAALSRGLDLFFKGFLSHQLEERYRHVYTVFSGGDDLFLIGPWYDMVLLLFDLRTWFSRQVCDHAGITLSASLVFGKPTTPVRLLAAKADTGLEQAKDAGRNRVTLAGATLDWLTAQKAIDLHRMMLDARAEQRHAGRGLNASLIYRLLRYAGSAGRVGAAAGADGTVSLADCKWRAQLSYDLARNLELPRNAASAPHVSALHERLNRLNTADAGMLKVAATLTLYVLRGER